MAEKKLAEALADQDREALLAVREQRDSYRRERDAANRRAGRLSDEVDDLEQQLSKALAIRDMDLRVPKWASQTPKTKAHIARPVLMLSDLHLDEVVKARDVDGVNEYNRKIAEQRLSTVVDNTVDFLRRYTAGIDFDGITVPLMGDILSGDIHDELVESNEATLPESIVHWVPVLAAALKHLADEFGRVHVPCVDGNHDRNYRKKRYKNKAASSWTWIIYNWLSQTLADDRIDFTISESSSVLLPIFETRFLIHHGDATRGGGGIGGVYPPIMRWVHKSQTVYASRGERFDIALIGHWHQLIYGQGVFINGSLVGWNEYSQGMAFPVERPQQMLFLVTPERGVTMRTAAHAD